MRNYDYEKGHEQDARLVPDIEKAINGQYSAIKCYAQLASMAPDREEKNRILEIRKDEIKHYEVFSKIYQGLTGKKPSPRIIEECPPEYREGLEASLKDEQETVDFYMDIAGKARHPYIRQQFMRASKDEQNHAVWFLYFYTRLCCER